MFENWYVLCVAILRKDVSVEQAFQLFKKGKKLNSIITNTDVEDMIKLKECCTYKEIGYMYGICESAVCKRIEYHRKKNPLQRAQI